MILFKQHNDMLNVFINIKKNNEGTNSNESEINDN